MIGSDVYQGARSIGGFDGTLEVEALEAFVAASFAGLDLDGRSVCLVVPDATRSCPMPTLMRAIHAACHGRTSRLTALVALGTHEPMSPQQLATWFGYDARGVDATYPGLHVANHEWWDPAALADLGVIGEERVFELSDGLLRHGVTVRINRHVLEHDLVVVVGPVFPHEVVGFSGGNKYFFPGVAGQEIIDLSHWLGALITSRNIIGTPGITPVRALIDEATHMIPTQRAALCIVVESGTGRIHSAAFGTPEQAWSHAAEVSAQTHVKYLDAAVPRVVSVISTRYPDMWTAAKGFYKVEPVVADGGEVVIVAPHIRELSRTHPEIAQIGYHVRDFFVQQWDRYAHLHWGVLAHSTHLRGAGSYDPINGERARVRVTLATAIPEDTVLAVNLGYRDPASLDLAACEADSDTLLVPDAGETLFRLR